MSNAAMAKPMSTGLYMFFFITCLFLLRQQQSGPSADDLILQAPTVSTACCVM